MVDNHTEELQLKALKLKYFSLVKGFISHLGNEQEFGMYSWKITKIRNCLRLRMSDIYWV